MEMSGHGKHGKARSRLSTLPIPLGNPCGDSPIPTAAAMTVKHLKTGKARRKPAHRDKAAMNGAQLLESHLLCSAIHGRATCQSPHGQRPCLFKNHVRGLKREGC